MLTEELVRELTSGKWFVTGGRAVQEIVGSPVPAGTQLPIVSVSLEENALRIVTGDHAFTVPCDHVSQDHPWSIEIRRAVTVREQRKQVDGGEFREVSKPGAIMLRFTNPATFDAWMRERQEREEREQEEQERREEEERKAQRQEFLMRLNACLGRTITGIDAVPGESVVLTFDNGTRLEVELDGGDIADAWLTIGVIAGPQA